MKVVSRSLSNLEFTSGRAAISWYLKRIAMTSSQEVIVLLPSLTCRVVVAAVKKHAAIVHFYKVDGFGRAPISTLKFLKERFYHVKGEVVLLVAAYCGNRPLENHLASEFASTGWHLVLDKTHAPTYEDEIKWDFEFASLRKFSGGFCPTMAKLGSKFTGALTNSFFTPAIYLNAIFNFFASRIVHFCHSGEFDGLFLSTMRDGSKKTIDLWGNEIEELRLAWDRCLNHLTSIDGIVLIVEKHSLPTPLICASIQEDHELSDVLMRFETSGIKTICWPSLAIKDLPAALTESEKLRKDQLIYIPVNQYRARDKDAQNFN